MSRPYDQWRSNAIDRLVLHNRDREIERRFKASRCGTLEGDTESGRADRHTRTLDDRSHAVANIAWRESMVHGSTGSIREDQVLKLGHTPLPLELGDQRYRVGHVDC